MILRKDNHKWGSAFMEYAVILGVASLVFIGMDTYIKRGLQGRVRDMADFFIGREQAADSNPTASTTSNSRTVSQATATNNALSGGGRRLALLDNTATSSTSRVIDDTKVARPEDFIPAEDAYVPTPGRPEPGEPPDGEMERESIEAQIAALEARREELRAEAEGLREEAGILEERGRELIERARHMDCHSSRCRRERRELLREGRRLLKQAGETMKQAQAKETAADWIDDQINELREKL